MVTEIVKVNKDLTTHDFCELVHVTTRRVSDAYLEYKSNHIDLKSILGICSICLTKGSEFTVVTKGDDEKILMAEIKNFFE